MCFTRGNFAKLQTPTREAEGESMNIHEYQAKELLAKFGVPVPAGFSALRRRGSASWKERSQH